MKGTPVKIPISIDVDTWYEQALDMSRLELNELYRQLQLLQECLSQILDLKN